MVCAPVLALPGFSIPFFVETNASDITIGVVLMQQNYHIVYFSKHLYPRLMCASTYIHELHYITTVVKKWRQYLLGHLFVIVTNHKSLKELMTQSIQTTEQQVYLSKLLGYDYMIQYCVGHHNIVADVLSRPSENSVAQFLVLSMPYFLFMHVALSSLSLWIYRFLKGAHFRALPPHFTAFQLA